MKYPYLPKGRKIILVKSDNKFMQEATRMLGQTGCAKQPTGAVIVKNGEILGRGANAGKLVEVCPRVLESCPTGVGYHLCKEVCEQVGHAEVSAIKDAKASGHDLRGASLYLDGHWWCCEACWGAMIEEGIAKVFLRNDSVVLYKRE